MMIGIEESVEDVIVIMRMEADVVKIHLIVNLIDIVDDREELMMRQDIINKDMVLVAALMIQIIITIQSTISNNNI